MAEASIPTSAVLAVVAAADGDGGRFDGGRYGYDADQPVLEALRPLLSVVLHSARGLPETLNLVYRRWLSPALSSRSLDLIVRW